MTSQDSNNDSSPAPPILPPVHPVDSLERSLNLITRDLNNSNLRQSAHTQAPMFGGYYSRSAPDLSNLLNGTYYAPPRVRLLQSPSTPFIQQDSQKNGVLKSITGSIKSMFSRKPKRLAISGPTNLVQHNPRDALSKGACSENVWSKQDELQYEEDQYLERQVNVKQHRQKPSVSWDDEHMSSDSSSGAVESSSTLFEQPQSLQLTPHPIDAQATGSVCIRSNPVLRTYTAPKSDSSTSPTDTASSALYDSRREHEPIGQWRCCKCYRGQDLYLHVQGQHLVSILNCICPHRSCENCTLTGLIKPYQPVSEPIPIPLSADNLKQVRFGVFCDSCGLSWRAQIVKGSSMLQQVSGIPKRGTNTLKKIRRAKSMNHLLGVKEEKMEQQKSVLNLRQLSSEMEKEHGKQAPIVMVNFSGIECTCGNVLDDCALCFQVAEPPKEVSELQRGMGEADEAAHTKSFTATPADRAKGIGKSMITLSIRGKTFTHPNPLMSNPVDGTEFKMLNQFSSSSGSRDGVSESDNSSK
jgi:hypothetical protein